MLDQVILVGVVWCCWCFLVTLAGQCCLAIFILYENCFKERFYAHECKKSNKLHINNISFQIKCCLSREKLC